jgi:hypothetical protein
MLVDGNGLRRAVAASCAVSKGLDGAKKLAGRMLRGAVSTSRAGERTWRSLGRV